MLVHVILNIFLQKQESLKQNRLCLGVCVYILSYILGTNLSPDVNLTNPVNICKKKKNNNNNNIYIYIYTTPNQKKLGQYGKCK